MMEALVTLNAVFNSRWDNQQPRVCHKFTMVVPIPDKLTSVKEFRQRLKGFATKELNNSNTLGLPKPVIIEGDIALLVHQGIECKDDALLDYYFPTDKVECFSCEAYVSYLTAQHVVHVKTLIGKTMDIPIGPLNTVGDLKLAITQLIGTPQETQRIIFAGKQLEDGHALREYDIFPSSTLHLLLRLRGGGAVAGLQFTDVSNGRASERFDWNPSAPDWRVAHQGLCIEGQCRNPRCPANRQMVIFNAGFTHFDLVVDAASQRCRCPKCNNPFLPETCAFNNCEWKYAGVKLNGPGGLPQAVQEANWQKVGNYYYRFPHTQSNQVSWSRLLLVVRKASDSSTNTSTPTKECSICWSDITSSSAAADIITTPCGHHFHMSCLRPWVQMGRTSCPNCRADISRVTRSVLQV